MRRVIAAVTVMMASVVLTAYPAVSLQAVLDGTFSVPTYYNGVLVAEYVNNHPVDTNGFVLDGSPQLDDAHCIGTINQRFICLEARHPTLVQLFIDNLVAAAPPAPCGWGVEQWLPELVLYPWPVGEMEKIMCRESGGNPTEWNGGGSGACGLFQTLPCPPNGLDGFTNIQYSYYEKYLPACLAGWCLAPWSQTA